jgi:hypothetical protein
MKKSRSGFLKSNLVLILVLGISITFSMIGFLNVGAEGTSRGLLGKMFSSMSSQGDSVGEQAEANLDPESTQSTVSITTFGTALTQNFNSLATPTATPHAASTLPSGWYFVETGGQGNATYFADNGNSNTGNTYSYGATGVAERALGTLRSANVIPTIGASFTNNTGKRIGSLDISYVGEQWRLGTTGREDRLNFEYSTNATSLSTGTWTTVSQLDFVAPIPTGTPRALDGNDSANRTAKSHTITALDIPDEATVWIRWVDVDAANADDGLAIDDFSLTASVKVADTTISSGPALITASNSATFAFSADDSDSTFECRLGSDSFESCESSKTYSGLSDGSYTFEVRATNSAGTDATPASYTWLVDTIAPEAPSITSSPASVTNSTSASFEFSGVDNEGGSGILKYQCKVDSGTSSGTYADCISGENLTGLSGGSYTFSVRSVDNAGNPGTATDYSWTVDLTAPEVSLTGPSGLIKDSTPTFEFSGTDNNAVDGLQCRIGDGAFEACVSPLTLGTPDGLNDGAYSIAVRSRDTAGNLSEVSTLSFTVDTVAPRIGQVPTPATIDNETATTVAFEVGDLNGIDSVELFYTTLVSNGPMAVDRVANVSSVTCSLAVVVPVEQNPVDPVYECEIPAITGPNYISFYVEAIDGAGNSSENPSSSTPNLVAIRGAMGEAAPLPPGTYTNVAIIGDQQLTGDVEILGVLSLEGPNFVTGGKIVLGCDANVDEGKGTGYIIGTVEKRFCTFNELFTYPIGVSEPGVNLTDRTQGDVSSIYAPATVRILEVPDPGSSLTIVAFPGTMAGTAPTNNIGVYWTTVETGSISADLRFEWGVSTEVGSPSLYSPLRRAGGMTEVVSIPAATIDLIDYTVEFFGVSEFNSSGAPMIDGPSGTVSTVPYSWSAGLIGTTAGSSILSGRVLSSVGLGLKDVTVTLIGGNLDGPITIKTNPFGRYNFSGLESGETYVLTVNSGRHSFGSPVKVVYLADSLTGEDFVADPK